MSRRSGPLSRTCWITRRPGAMMVTRCPTARRILRDRLRPLDVFVDEGDVAERHAALEDHASPGLPVRSMLVNRVTIERRAARAMGFTR